MTSTTWLERPTRTAGLPRPAGPPGLAQRAASPDTDEAPDTQDDEWRLRDAAVTGNGDAFAVLYRRCHHTVYRYLVRRLHGDHHLADDLTSETFARALTRISSYQDMGKPFVAWLLTIANNLAADYYKSGWRRFQVPCGDLGLEHDRAGGTRDLAPADSHDDEVDSRVVADQLRQHVREVLDSALGALTERQRRVVRMRYVHGMSVRDTADRLGVHEGAVKAACYRAVRVLARDPRLRMLKQELTGED